MTRGTSISITLRLTGFLGDRLQSKIEENHPVIFPEGWCEFCPIQGKCCVCGSDHGDCPPADTEPKTA